jgi:hypothetical protein
MEKLSTRPTVLSVSKETEKKAAMLLFKVAFFVAVYFISTRVQIVLDWSAIWPFFFLAVLRAARSISFNEIGEELRAPFTEVKTDSCGAGADVHPKGEGAQYVIGSLMACPICSGTWSALALFGAYSMAPAFGTALIIILGMAGGSEILHYVAQYFEWGARRSRVISGVISPDKE